MKLQRYQLAEQFAEQFAGKFAEKLEQLPKQQQYADQYADQFAKQAVICRTINNLQQCNSKRIRESVCLRSESKGQPDSKSRIDAKKGVLLPVYFYV